MQIRTYDGRVFLLNDTFELVQDTENKNDSQFFTIYLQKMEDTNEKILVLKTKDRQDHHHVYCQAINLLRSRYTSMLDFEAMLTNPNKSDYNTASIEWNKKKSKKVRKNGG